jgi:membrane protein DedA with SNARE-associated domain
VIIPISPDLGYPAVAGLIFGECAGLPIPGETALIVAGGLAASGRLSLPIVVLIAALAATLGATLGYWIGRRRGRALLLRDGRGAVHRRAAAARGDRFFARYGSGAVFLGRFIPGVRYVGALMAGASRMPWRRFAVANAAGAVLWALTIATLSDLLGSTASIVLAGTGLAFGAAALALAFLQQRRRAPVAP